MRKISITTEIEQLVETEYVDAIHNSTFHHDIVNELTTLKDEFRRARSIDVNTGSSRPISSNCAHLSMVVAVNMEIIER